MMQTVAIKARRPWPTGVLCCLLLAPLLAGAANAPDTAGVPHPAAPTAEARGEPPGTTTTPPDKPEPPPVDTEQVSKATHSVADSLASAWAMMVKMLLGLAAVLILVYLLLGKGLAKYVARNTTGRAIKVVDRVGLDPRRALYLVEVDGVRTLVGTGENAITMVVLPSPPPRAFEDCLHRDEPPHGANGLRDEPVTPPAANKGEP